jgi:hypothetical protein
LFPAPRVGDFRGGGSIVLESVSALGRWRLRRPDEEDPSPSALAARSAAVTRASDSSGAATINNLKAWKERGSTGKPKIVKRLSRSG